MCVCVCVCVCVCNEHDTLCLLHCNQPAVTHHAVRSVAAALLYAGASLLSHIMLLGRATSGAAALLHAGASLLSHIMLFGRATSGAAALLHAGANHQSPNMLFAPMRSANLQGECQLLQKVRQGTVNRAPTKEV